MSDPWHISKMNKYKKESLVGNGFLITPLSMSIRTFPIREVHWSTEGRFARSRGCCWMLNCSTGPYQFTDCMVSATNTSTMQNTSPEAKQSSQGYFFEICDPMLSCDKKQTLAFINYIPEQTNSKCIWAQAAWSLPYSAISNTPVLSSDTPNFQGLLNNNVTKIMPFTGKFGSIFTSYQFPKS